MSALMTTSEVMAARGITRRQVGLLVARGTLRPVVGGRGRLNLFSAGDVGAVALSRPRIPHQVQMMTLAIGVAAAGDECLHWPFSRLPAGYGIVGGRAVGRQYAHSLACTWAHGPRPEGKQAAHSCGKASCFNPKHLRWATVTENHADKVLHGTSGRGVSRPSKQVAA